MFACVAFLLVKEIRADLFEWSLPSLVRSSLCCEQEGGRGHQPIYGLRLQHEGLRLGGSPQGLGRPG